MIWTYINRSAFSFFSVLQNVYHSPLPVHTADNNTLSAGRVCRIAHHSYGTFAELTLLLTSQNCLHPSEQNNVGSVAQNIVIHCRQTHFCAPWSIRLCHFLTASCASRACSSPSLRYFRRKCSAALLHPSEQ